MSKSKKKKGFWIFLFIWSLLLIGALTAALIWFYDFLGDYQKVYDETRPALFMEKIVPLFEEPDTDRILAIVDSVPLGTFEGREQLEDYLSQQLTGKSISYGTKAGEHIEERPAYVITVDEEPFAVIRLKKQSQTAQYGHPLWEINQAELLINQGEELFLQAPTSLEITVNGMPLTQERVVEENLPDARATHFNGYATIPSISRYSLGCFYGAPVITAKNIAGEEVEVTFDEAKKCYVADFGGYEELRENVEEFAIQAVMDYAMYVSNDASYGALDKYFPEGSELLVGIKKNQREWFDYHLTPEIKNQAMTSFTAFSEEAFCARIYLEQYMYVPFSKKTEMLVTDLNVYFVCMDGYWKIAGIAFE